MKTSKITKHDLERSVIAVPPLCRDTQLKVDATQNKLLIKHIESGGVRDNYCFWIVWFNFLHFYRYSHKCYWYKCGECGK